MEIPFKTHRSTAYMNGTKVFNGFKLGETEMILNFICKIGERPCELYIKCIQQHTVISLLLYQVKCLYSLI